MVYYGVLNVYCGSVIHVSDCVDRLVFSCFIITVVLPMAMSLCGPYTDSLGMIY